MIYSPDLIKKIYPSLLEFDYLNIKFKKKCYSADYKTLTVSYRKLNARLKMRISFRWRVFNFYCQWKLLDDENNKSFASVDSSSKMWYKQIDVYAQR